MRTYADSSFILRLVTGEADSPQTIAEYRRACIHPNVFYLHAARAGSAERHPATRLSSAPLRCFRPTSARHARTRRRVGTGSNQLLARREFVARRNAGHGCRYGPRRNTFRGPHRAAGSARLLICSTWPARGPSKAELFLDHRRTPGATRPNGRAASLARRLRGASFVRPRWTDWRM